MKITYTAPNRSHHYPYAEALNRAGVLNAFISGFSRFSPRAPLPSVGSTLKRHDFFQNLYLAANRFNAPNKISSSFNKLSNWWLDKCSLPWAQTSDVFIYYRTQGYNTTRKLHRLDSSTLCVLEEVNSHVDTCLQFMREEYERLQLGTFQETFPDHALRLEAYDEADCILCPSSFVYRSFLAKGFDEKKLLKVNFGFTPSSQIEGPSIQNSDKFRMLFVGQLHYRKGLRYAIDAFKKLKHPNKEFVIVGPKTQVTGLEKTTIPQGVVFTGPLKGDALAEQYRNANVFILPSLEEGLALVQGEALSFGLPLLITTNTGGDDLIKNGSEGFIVNCADIDALVDKLQLLADDKVLRQQMSYAAFEASKTLGSWDVAAENLIFQLQNKIKTYK